MPVELQNPVRPCGNIAVFALEIFLPSFTPIYSLPVPTQLSGSLSIAQQITKPRIIPCMNKEVVKDNKIKQMKNHKRRWITENFKV